ncbi:hypothetical protein C8F04DRAFT_1068237 [Mycena alexandri]|uniref:DUF6533 domain-containing protein n=1 Tax=Mycena alexandri TaxID=1745969 RepID=A0AAD6TEU9_9AGAR|nr:hypothetical protein C8F04DRAFT_1068237 [Mycena alexandri]
MLRSPLIRPCLHRVHLLEFMLMLTFSRIYRYVFLAGLVIAVYDHLLTFSTEVKYIWLTKLRPSTCWFLAARYIGLIGNIIVSVFYFGALSHEVCSSICCSVRLNQVRFYVLSKSCIRMLTVWEIFIISQEGLIETTLSIRVFAMYDRNIWVLVPLLVLVCISMTLAVVGAVKLDGPAQNLAAPGINGCNTPYSRSTADHVAKAWMGILACDVLVFALTVRQAYMQHHRSKPYAGSLILRMLKDGSMYFGVIVLATIANISTLYLGDILLSGFLCWFTSSLSLTLLCRLMLNLHDAGAGRIDTLELNTLDLASIQPRGNDDGDDGG